MTVGSAVVGGAGQVGRELLSILAADERFDAPLVQGRSVGVEVPFRDRALTTQAVDRDALAALDLVFLCTPAGVSRELAPRIASATTVIDLSSAFRMEDGVPLVVPEINAAALEHHGGLVANPNCTTIINALVADALHRRFGLRRMILSSYQAVSGAGRRGAVELEASARAALDGGEIAAEVFQEPIAFNGIPWIGSPAGSDGSDGSDRSGEEQKVCCESRKILGLPDLEMEATCVRVDFPRCHAVSTFASFEQPVDLSDARALLGGSAGLEWNDLPTPMRAANQDNVLVGRVRGSTFDDSSLSWWAVGDQLRKGAALNAVQIAAALRF